MSEIVCRKLGKSDIAPYRAIRLEGLSRDPGSFGTTYEEEVRLERLRMERHMEEEAIEPFVIGAFHATELVGICAFSRDHHRKIRHRGLVTQVYVRQEFRGRGIGRALLRTLIGHAFAIEEVEQLELGVVSTNVSAIRLYESLGFTVYGLQPRYFKNDGAYEDQQFMQLLK